MVSGKRVISVVAGAAMVASGVLVAMPGTAPAGAATATVSAYCAHGSTKPFKPTSIRIPGITKHAKVLALPRHGRARVRSAPVTKKGAREFAWDAPRPKPGAKHGNVRLNAHTWPWSDPIALGNAMLRRLRPGDRIVVRGKRAGRAVHLCYRVTRQVQIRAKKRYHTYYSLTGSPKLAIMVCSGRRRGPGNWDHRMVWYAAPYGVRHRTKPKPSQHPKPTPAPSAPKPTGIGAILGAILGG